MSVEQQPMPGMNKVGDLLEKERREKEQAAMQQAPRQEMPPQRPPNMPPAPVRQEPPRQPQAQPVQNANRGNAGKKVQSGRVGDLIRSIFRKDSWNMNTFIATLVVIVLTIVFLLSVWSGFYTVSEKRWFWTQPVSDPFWAIKQGMGPHLAIMFLIYLGISKAETHLLSGKCWAPEKDGTTKPALAIVLETGLCLFLAAWDFYGVLQLVTSIVKSFNVGLIAWDVHFPDNQWYTGFTIIVLTLTFAYGLEPAFSKIWPYWLSRFGWKPKAS